MNPSTGSIVEYVWELASRLGSRARKILVDTPLMSKKLSDISSSCGLSSRGEEEQH